MRLHIPKDSCLMIVIPTPSEAGAENQKRRISS
jgi:hypothetical protein